MVGAVVGSVSFCVGSPAVSDGLVSAGVFTPPVGFVSSGETAGFSVLPAPLARNNRPSITAADNATIRTFIFAFIALPFSFERQYPGGKYRRGLTQIC